MNKNLSLAIEKAVRNFPSKQEIKDLDKRPDLFSLTQETELFQNDRGITVKIDRSKDSNLTNFGKATLSDRYLGFNESFQDLFARVASTYADNNLHGQRIYNYISDLWFMPATPILSNGGTKRGLPISCFLNEATDSLKETIDLWNEKRTSAGIGTRLVTGSGFVYRLDFATGKEGGSTIVIFDYPWGTFGQ